MKRAFVVPAGLAFALTVLVLPAIIGRAAPPIFTDDFETGNIGKWAVSARFTAQQQQVFGGSWAGRATASSATAYAAANLATPQPDLFFETRVNLLSSSGTVRILRLARATGGTGGGIVSLRVAANGTVSIRNDVSGTITTSTTRMSKAAWHEVQVHARVGAGSVVETWIDGVRIAGLSFSTSLGTNPVGRIQLGSQSTATMDAAYDDVSAATEFITGGASPPTVPQNLRTTSVAGNRVDLAWSASTDDTGVTGYGIYRDGSIVGSVPGTETAFSDGAVTPRITYAYTVDAFDGTERSARSSPPLSVTTPSLDTQAPSTPTGLTASATGATRVDLAWQPSSDDVGVAGYAIYRDGAELATVGGTRTSFTDVTAQPVTTYTYAVDAFDAAGNRSGRLDPAEATTPEATGSGATVLMAAGDICPAIPSNCSGTASLVLASNPDMVLALGDNQYPSGTLAEYAASYDLQWGQFKEITRPAPGNHEWKTPNAQGYKDYYGPSVLTDGNTWYSFNIGGWHVVSLDSQCNVVGCTTASPQYAWLQQDLAADDRACTIGFWHRPRFSSGSEHGSYPMVQPLWDLLGAEGAEVILAGHEHSYERFAPQTGLGVASPTGIREFVVGTGGNCCYGFRTPVANSEVRITGSRGLLELTLDASSYAWRFIAVDGSVLDSGTGSCH